MNQRQFWHFMRQQSCLDLKNMKEDGKSIIIIPYKLNEALEISDRGQYFVKVST